MKPFLQPGTARLDQARIVRYAAGMLAVFGSAFMVGDLVAHETWRYLALLGAAVLALCWPFEIALGTYAFTVPFNSVTALGNTSDGTTTLNWVLGALAGVALLSVGIIGKRLRWPPRAALWGALLVGWALLSTVWALQARNSEHWIPTAVSLALLYLVASCWKLTERQFSILTKLIIIGGCLAAGFTVYQYLRGVTWTTTFMGSTTRGSLVVGEREANPNSLGTDLLLPFSLAMAWFFSARRSLSWLLGFCAACLIVGAVFLTMSRGSILSAGVIVAVYFLRLRNRRMLLIVAAFLLTALLMPSSFYTRIESSVRDAGSGRLEIWSVGARMVKHHGITGVGLANFPVAYNTYAGQASRFVGFGRGAHNIYLEIAVELGIVGMILLVGALASHIRTVRSLPVARSPNMQFLALEAACWAMIVAGLFEAIAWNKSFWLTWTLCLMAAQAYRRTSESPVPVPDAERFWEADCAERQEAVGR